MAGVATQVDFGSWVQKGGLPQGAGWFWGQCPGQHRAKTGHTSKELLSFLRNRAATGEGEEDMCDQTPTCVLSTWTNTPEVMHTPYPQSQNHLLSTKPSLPSGQGRKITPRHTHTLSWDVDKQAHCPKLSPLSVTDCGGLFSGLSWCLSKLIVFSDLCFDFQHNWTH